MAEIRQHASCKFFPDPRGALASISRIHVGEFVSNVIFLRFGHTSPDIVPRLPQCMHNQTLCVEDYDMKDLQYADRHGCCHERHEQRSCKKCLSSGKITKNCPLAEFRLELL